MNHITKSPIERLNPHEKWYRFNSLPFEIQEQIIKLLLIASGDGLDPIIARAKLDKLHGLSDNKIVDLHNFKSPNNNFVHTK
jgi:hypothetical protein